VEPMPTMDQLVVRRCGTMGPSMKPKKRIILVNLSLFKLMMCKLT
jgi:hypothetical protein